MWFMRTSSLTHQTPALKPHIHFKALPSPILTSKIRYAVKHCSPSSSLLLQQFNITTFFYNINTHEIRFFIFYLGKSLLKTHRNVLYQLVVKIQFLTDYLNQNHLTSIKKIKLCYSRHNIACFAKFCQRKYKDKAELLVSKQHTAAFHFLIHVLN